MGIEEAIAGRRSIRRSIRRFDARPLPPGVVTDLVALACTAPAPHHSRPWRFVAIASAHMRARLARSMGEAWRRDLESDGVAPETIASLLAGARRRLTEPPLLLLACIVLEDARRWPDQRRRRAERDMYVQSLGAALQNLMLAAHARGLASYLMAAPLFCPQAVRESLDLPTDYEPQFLVALGYPQAGFAPPPRPPLNPEDVILQR